MHRVTDRVYITEAETGGFPMTALTVLAAMLVLAGLLAFAGPMFNTQHTEDVARIGGRKSRATEHRSYGVPPFVSGGALLLGMALIGAGLYQRR